MLSLVILKKSLLYDKIKKYMNLIQSATYENIIYSVKIPYLLYKNISDEINKNSFDIISILYFNILFALFVGLLKILLTKKILIPLF